MQINLQMPFDFCTFATEFPQVDQKIIIIFTNNI